MSPCHRKSAPCWCRARPRGATLFVDGHLAIGLTPTSVELELEDFHELRIEKDGFEGAVRRIVPESRDASVSVQLEPERFERATLYVDANSAADVWIDGVDTGFTTPTLGVRLLPGVHHVEVREGDKHAAREVTLVKGQIQRVLLTPADGPASEEAAP